MGRNQSNSSTAVIAVIFVAGLLLLFIVGAAALLFGGIFFYSSLEPAPMAVQYSMSPDAQPITAPSAPTISMQADGQLEVEGESLSLEELPAHLEEATEQAGGVPPQLLFHADCPAEMRQPVIDIFVEVTGEEPITTFYQNAEIDVQP